MPTPLDPTVDGHTHTHFCPHGSRRHLREYLAQAVARGLTAYAVTEHIPLPARLVDPMGPYECAGPLDELDDYLACAEALRDEWAGRLEVRVGLEIDYLGAAQGGHHGELLRILSRVHPRLDPRATLLSVHFLDDGLVDGTPGIAAALAPGEPADAVHLRYYAALTSGIQASWRWGGRDLRPRRLAHLTLPAKFQRVRPLHEPERVLDAATVVLALAAGEGLEVEVNTAGLDKADCGETYLPRPLLDRAVELGVTLALGSDAHDPREVARRFPEAIAAVRAAGGAVGQRR